MVSTVWKKKELSLLCNVFADGDWIEKKDQSQVGMRLIQTGNIGNGYFKDRAEKARYISEKTFKRLNCTEIFPEDCLISRLPDPVGRACLIPQTGERMITAVDCTIIRFTDEIIPQWFVNYSLSHEYQNQINREVGGSTRQRISRTNLGKVEIPLPSLSEQKRILKKVELVFEKVEKAKESAEKNLQNSREIFDSYLRSVFANPGKDWEEKRLDEILDIERGGSPRPIQKYLTINPDGINWIKIGDTKGSDKYITATSQKIKTEGLRKTRLVYPGDFLLSNSMSFGRPYILKISGAIHDGWLVLREKNQNQIDKDYLYNILGSAYVFSQFDRLAAGSTVRNLNINLVSGVKIPLPKIPEQKAIVKKLDAVYAQTKKLEKIYQQKLVDLEELKKSVLNKAFTGDL